LEAEVAAEKQGAADINFMVSRMSWNQRKQGRGRQNKLKI
jgi:hypothetical protein